MNKGMLIALVVLACALAMQCTPASSQDDDLRMMSGRQDQVGDVDSRRPLTEDELVQLRQSERIQEFNETTSRDEGRTIHPALMRGVVDNSMGIRFEERQAYLHVLKLAHEVPIRWLERYAEELRTERREQVPSYQNRRFRDFPQFVDLFTEPDAYRGRPVTIQGILRKLTKFHVGVNSLGLDEVYEGWVFTPDSQGNPVVVVFTSKDDRLPVRGDLQEEVRFTGYFFKMYGYDAQDTQRKSPLILAGELELIPQPQRLVARANGLEWYAFTTIGFLLCLYTIWLMNRQSAMVRHAPEVEPDFRHFPPQEHPALNPTHHHSIVETEDS